MENPKNEINSIDSNCKHNAKSTAGSESWDYNLSKRS